MKDYIVQVKVKAEMEERAEMLIRHCIDAGVIVGNFLEGERAKVINSFEALYDGGATNDRDK